MRILLPLGFFNGQQVEVGDEPVEREHLPGEMGLVLLRPGSAEIGQRFLPSPVDVSLHAVQRLNCWMRIVLNDHGASSFEPIFHNRELRGQECAFSKGTLRSLVLK